MGDSISNFFEDGRFSGLPSSPEDLFSVFNALEGLKEAIDMENNEDDSVRRALLFHDLSENEHEVDEQPKTKRAKRVEEEEEIRRVLVEGDQGNNKVSHITVERNRRKQMNEHLNVLRSLMPCFYVKRGDQASIIGGVVDYINELQQVLQSLEAKKQRKVYSEVLSPRFIPSPRPSPTILSPRKPPLSPRLNLPISPRTPQPSSPYNRPRMNLSPTMATPIELSPSTSTSSLNDCVANSKSSVAEVEVKFSGPNLIVKTISPRIPGQIVKIISALEDLSLEVLHISISTLEETMLNSFTIKIGIECQLSAEELAHQIQQTFCPTPPII